jgi:hypothetical protein
LNAVFIVVRGPVHKDARSPLLLLQQMINLSIISIAVLKNECASDAGLHKRATFSTLIVGPDGPGDQTRATCVVGSGTRRSTIHYDYFVVEKS